MLEPLAATDATGWFEGMSEVERLLMSALVDITVVDPAKLTAATASTPTSPSSTPASRTAFPNPGRSLPRR